MWVSNVALPSHSGDLEVAYVLSLEAACGWPGRATVEAAYGCQASPCRAIVEISSLLMGVKRDLGPQWRSRGCLWVSNVALPGHSGDVDAAYGCQA